MANPPLTAGELEERLDEFLDPVLSSRRTAAGPAQSLAGFAWAQQDFILRWVEIIAKTNAEMAYQFASRAGEALRVMSLSDIEGWIIHAMDIYDKKGLYPACTILGELNQYANSIKEAARGISFDDVSGVLALFIQGLAGRPLKLEASDETYTDTNTLYLPHRIASFARREDNFRLYKATAAHLWAQTWFGTFQGLDGSHVSLTEAVSRFPDSERAVRLFNALETLRLDARIAAELAGLGRDLRELQRLHGEVRYPAHWAGHIRRLQQPGANVIDTYAVLPLVYNDPVPEPLCYQGRLMPERVEQAVLERLAREKDAFRTALARFAQEGRKQPQRPGPAPEGEAKDPARRFQIDQFPDPERPDHYTFELRLDGEPVVPPADVRALMDSIIQDLGMIPEDYLVAAGDGGYRRHGVEEKRPEDVWKGTYHEEGAFIYNEWDYKRQHYRKGWCVLREIDVHPTDAQFVERTLGKYAGLLTTLRKTFEILRGENKLVKRQTNGDDIDLDALVEAYADMRHGMEMTNRVFTKMHKLERNIAVMLMVDMSGSTKGWVNDAEREALVLLCETLEILGDRYAIYGFSGMTRKRCELFRVKRFDEGYSDTVRSRISGIKPQDYTRMGVTIRHLTYLLGEVDARTKLLITLSDGKPDDYDGYRGDYGIEDTRQALIEAKRAGVHPFCITIDTEARDYLPHMYGAVNYAVIDDVRKLPLKVSDIYRRLTF